MKPSSTPSPYPFPFPPPAPNPPLYFHSLPQPPPAAPPIPDLSTSLSSLTHLLSLSHQTLNSLSSLLPSAKPPNSHFVPCLNNPHHLLPPESLFLHSLRCPSPLFEDLKPLIDSLYYRKTLTPSENPPIQDSSGELCVSLDRYFKEFASYFFYQDCPGVVNFSRFDNANRSFVIPSVLSVECANACGSSEGDFQGFYENEFIILPSDLWAIRREVEGWVDYPSVYSYAAFCAILKLNSINWTDLSTWIISSSPRFGIVIDVYMRDHISVLFTLCLKAVRKEAVGFLCHKTMSFNCPVLGQVLKWIASQLSVLYGEVNAKFFVMHIFNKCVLEVANHVLLPLESSLEDEAKELDGNKNELRDVKLNEDSKTSTGCKVGLEADERVDKKVIFISQVAASVAALHERSLLEAKIRKMREFQHVPRYQRMLEHDYISKRAEEVRNTRPDFRAIIDHDGLPRKPSNNQETGKLKTREELLAEERDYKRRRMSYRGKKLKRTPLQVMRDIIDEYTEEIKQAGGIGCFEKGNEEEEISRIATSISDVTGDQMLGTIHQKQPQSDSRTSKDAPTHNYNQQGQGHHRNHLEYQRSSGQDRRARDEYSRSPDRHRSYGSYHDRRSRHRKHDAELTDDKRRERRSSSKSDYRYDKSSYSGKKNENANGRQRDRRRRHENQNDGFDDRYDPAESRDVYGDDVDAVSY